MRPPAAIVEVSASLARHSMYPQTLIVLLAPGLELRILIEHGFASDTHW